MQPFGNFPNESITLVKKDGRRIATQAIVSASEMLVLDVKLPVEVGDTVERAIPNGQLENYEVLDPGYSPAFGGIPARFCIKVRNLAVQRRPPSSVVHHTTNYNNSGQVGAMGANANAANNVMVQQLQEPWSAEEFSQLAAELSQLRKAIAKQLADDDTAADAIEIGHVGAAEKAAKGGDHAGVIAGLKSLGRKTWGLAEQLGLAYLKHKAGDYLGLPPGGDK